MVDLEDFRTMLIERVEEWNRELREQGRREGRKEGRELLLRQLEIKFGQLEAPTRARVLAARPQSLMRWAERLLTAERLADVFGR